VQPEAFLIGGLAAVGVLLVVVAVAQTMSRGDIDARIERYATRRPGDPDSGSDPFDLNSAVTASKAFASVDRMIERRSFGANLAREIARADLRIKVGEYLLIWAAITLGVPSVMFLLSRVFPTLGSPLALIVGMLVAFMAPRTWLSNRVRRRQRAFDDQLPDTITLIANALRAGSSFLQACELVTRQTQPPISQEFGRLIREVNYGLAFEQALDNTARRIKSPDFGLLATAIAIQYQVGGNLAEVLDSIAFTIRERVRIKGEVRALTAQQRLSGFIVALLPVGLGVILATLFPRFMAPMLEQPPSFLGFPLGVALLAFGGLMMLMGMLLVRRIVDIDL
jgi:tight adherence protein B